MRATGEQDGSAAPTKTAAGNANRATLRAGGVAVIIAGLGGIAWTTLELLPPSLGFDDTDNPAVSLEYLRQYPQFYALAGLVGLVMAIAYVVASFAVSDALAPRTSSITRRSLSALGVLSAGFFFMHGVMRESVWPLLYIDSMKSEWGESGYLTIQMVATHGFGGAALIMLSVWVVGISVAGARSHALPTWLCLLGLVSGLRIVLLIAGPFLTTAGIEVPGFVWVASMVLIPLGMLWWLGLGVVLLVKSRPNREQRRVDPAR